MNKITRPQFCSLLLITDAFSVFCLKGKISLITIFGFLTLIFIQMIIFLLLEKITAFPKEFGKTLSIILMAYLIYMGGHLFSEFYKALEVISIPCISSNVSGKLIVSGLAALTCLYITSTGIKALSRAAVIASAVGIMCIAAAFIIAVFSCNFENISYAQSSESFSGELLRGISVSGSIGSFIVYLNYTRSNRIYSTICYFTCKAVLTSVLLITSVLVVGGIMDITEFPIITSAQLSQPFNVQRIDSLFLIVFSVFGVFSAAIQASAAVSLSKTVFPNYTKNRSSIVLVLMIAVFFIKN